MLILLKRYVINLKIKIIKWFNYIKKQSSIITNKSGIIFKKNWLIRYN